MKNTNRVNTHLVTNFKKDSTIKRHLERSLREIKWSDPLHNNSIAQIVTQAEYIVKTWLKFLLYDIYH